MGGSNKLKNSNPIYNILINSSSYSSKLLYICKVKSSYMLNNGTNDDDDDDGNFFSLTIQYSFLRLMPIEIIGHMYWKGNREIIYE